MGKHPIRYGVMCPLRIALTLGQVAHATSGAKSRTSKVLEKNPSQNSPRRSDKSARTGDIKRRFHDNQRFHRFPTENRLRQ